MLIGLAIGASAELFAQEVPCRQWYIKRDRNGNELKTNCKEAWQVNADGQKHGRYIEYYEDGTPKTSASYLNGMLNGVYKSFSGDGVSVIETGIYSNGEKNGKWLESNGTGSYKNGIYVGLWNYSDHEDGKKSVDYDSKRLIYNWWNLSFVVGLGASKDLNGDILLGFEITKSDLAITVNGAPQRIQQVKVDRDFIFREKVTNSETVKNLFNGSGQSSISYLQYPLELEPDFLGYLMKHLYSRHKAFVPSGNLQIFVSAKITNDRIDWGKESAVFDKSGKELERINFLNLFAVQSKLDVQKRNVFLDSVRNVLFTYSDNKKLIYSPYIEADALKKYVSEVIDEVKTRRPEPFTKNYIERLDREICDASMIGFNPYHYSGMTKINENILVMMQDAGMKLTEKVIEYGYYIDYNITEGKFDGIQTIGYWDENMVLKEGRVRPEFRYVYKNGIKKSYDDIGNKRHFDFNENGEALDYQALFSGIIDSNREYYLNRGDYERFSSYAESLFNRYKSGNYKWARDTVYYYALGDADRANDIALLTKIYESAKSEGLDRKYFANYEWKILASRNQNVEALKSLSEVIKLYPEDVVLIYDKSVLETSLGKYQESIQTISAIKDAGYLVHFVIGTNYMLLNDKTKAKEYILKFYQNTNGAAYQEAQAHIGLLADKGVNWSKLKFATKDYYGKPQVDYNTVKAFLGLN